MKAGREIDYLVHIFFMNNKKGNLHLDYKNESYKDGKILRNVPRYSTEFRNLNKIINKFISEHTLPSFHFDGHWTVELKSQNHQNISFTSNSLCYAFCVAALLYRGWTTK